MSNIQTCFMGIASWKFICAKSSRPCFWCCLTNSQREAGAPNLQAVSRLSLSKNPRIQSWTSRLHPHPSQPISSPRTLYSQPQPRNPRPKLPINITATITTTTTTTTKPPGKACCTRRGAMEVVELQLRALQEKRVFLSVRA